MLLVAWVVRADMLIARLAASPPMTEVEEALAWPVSSLSLGSMSTIEYGGRVFTAGGPRTERVSGETYPPMGLLRPR